MSPAHDVLRPFHPVIRSWFAQAFGMPTAPQIQGWLKVFFGHDVLIAAPTGSGKTLAAFLPCIDGLFRSFTEGTLRDETRILYVSPLKALGNDVQKNVLTPLQQLQQHAHAQGITFPALRALVRSGDSTASQRVHMVKKPPHILITTPESLYLYLTARHSRATLKSVRTVIVDEIHALAQDKRGSHFALSMERLKALTSVPVQLVGLSATSKPLGALARFLTGTASPERRDCEVVQVGHLRPLELSIEVPEDELSSVATLEMWGQFYDFIARLSSQHRTMLVFTNTRRLAERIAHDMGMRLGQDAVAAHHGSMAKEARLAAENRLKEGQLKVLVATASLELGIDIGSIDFVVQVGSPRSIAVMLQRLGRSGHRHSAVARGAIFALTRDELLEATALVRAIHEGRLDKVRQPISPKDVLAQQLVAEVAAQDWDEEALFQLCRRAAPYAALSRDEYRQLLQLVCEGLPQGRGRGRVHVHWDRVHGVLRARRGARLFALQNAGAIADVFSYPVIVEPEDKQVGTLDEDFSIESMPGDVFVLGSTSWRIRRIFAGQVRVENAKGQPPSIPFWNGEAPARSVELSWEVSRLKADMARLKGADKWAGLSPGALAFLQRYIEAGVAALTHIPTQETVIAERFFDEAGGMQLVLHAPFGARINRAWGLALRKCFCRAFDFELQAAATDDGVLLSLGAQHSFPLADIFDFVSPNVAETVVTQAVLQSPLFGTRFRWAAGRALMLPKMRNGKRVPPPIQRAQAEDFLASVFPAQLGCQDNRAGHDIEVPQHPLVAEALHDCLRWYMDVDGFIEVLQKLKSGAIGKVAVDVSQPSVFAHQFLNSAPYTFLDDAPLEERRARTVLLRHTLPARDVAAFGALDEAAIARVVEEAAPVIRNAEEFHDALLQLCLRPRPRACAPEEEASYFESLGTARRAASFEASSGCSYSYAAECVPQVQALFPDAVLTLSPLPDSAPMSQEAAALSVVRGWMEILGPVTVAEVASRLSLSHSTVETALARLEASGQVLRGAFQASQSDAVQWCNRRLLQRIHRLTLGRLRRDIEALSAQDFMRFLFRWHHLDAASPLQGPGGLLKAIGLLEGYEAPAAAWEKVLFPARMQYYFGQWLADACFAGEVAWGRLSPRIAKAPQGPRRGGTATYFQLPQPRKYFPGRTASLSFVRRENLPWLLQAARFASEGGGRVGMQDLSQDAEEVLQVFQGQGASFFGEIQQATRRLPAQVEDALWELLAGGFITADAVQNLRVLQSPKLRRRQRALQRGGPGRFYLLTPQHTLPPDAVRERLAWLFLRRYGIVFRDLLQREALAPAWRDLLPVYRRLEARGEVRGGRFVSGLVGEQFALPEAVDMARALRREAKSGTAVHLAAVDPLNLTGVVTPGARVAAVFGQEVHYVDGVP